MSGLKLYHLDMSAWFRRQIRERVGALVAPALLEDVRARTRAELQGDLDRMQRRQNDADATVQRLSEQARRVEEQTNQRLRAHVASVDQQLRQHRNSVDAQLGEIRTFVEDQGKTLRGELAEVREQARRETAELRATMIHEKEGARVAATAWLSDAQAMRDLIAESLPHERYAPDALHRLDQRLDSARSTLEQGHSQAALAAGQGVFHELSDLRVDLELQHREWVLLRATALEALGTVRRTAEESGQRPVHGPDGRELVGSSVDVDHWSRGELGVLRAKLADAEDALRADDSPMSMDDLRRVVDTTAPGYASRLDEIVETAEQRLIASQLRVNVAQEVVDTLDRVGGYILVSGRYESEDFREAYYTRLDHPNGNQIVVEVAPEDSGPFGSTVRVVSYDHDIGAESMQHARARDIADALRRRGLPVPEPVSEAGEPDRRYLAIAAGDENGPTPRPGPAVSGEPG